MRRYGFVGSTLRCPNTCQVQTVGPNGASALDGVASILAHEIAETITDPNTDAWCAGPPGSGSDRRRHQHSNVHLCAFAKDAFSALLAAVTRRARARAQQTAVQWAAYRTRD